LLFNLSFQYAIRRVQVNQGWLEIKQYTPALVYADDVNILGGSIPTIKENRSSSSF
jgi:hypothetical protein